VVLKYHHPLNRYATTHHYTLMKYANYI